MPNPIVEKLYEGVMIARENHVDLLLAVGGGSCCDYAQVVYVSVNCKEDPWNKYYLRFNEPDCDTLPVSCVLTMMGSGSEMNGGTVKSRTLSIFFTVLSLTCRSNLLEDIK